MTTHTTTARALPDVDLLIERLSDALVGPQVDPGDLSLRYARAFGRLLYLVAYRQPDLAEAIIREGSPKVTFDQFMAAAAFDRPHQRDGQAAFNALYEVHPHLADRIRASAVDPFHNDAKLPEFWDFVGRNW